MRPQTVSTTLWLAVLSLVAAMLVVGGEAVTGNLLSRPSAICGTAPFRFSLSGVTGSDTVIFSTDRAGISIPDVDFGVGNSGPFDVTIDCGNAQGTFGLDALLSSNNQRLFGFEAFCKGDLFFPVDVVRSTVRGNDFDIVVQISPPAQEEVELTVNIDNPLIIPGGHRITIAVGETEGRMHFLSPVGDVGPVNINLHSRKLFDYGPRLAGGNGCSDSSLTLPFKVLGTMTTSFFPATIGDGVIESGFVDIDPPAGKGGVLVSVDYSDVGIGSPSVIRIDEGESVGAFQVLPQSTGDVKNLVFTAEYYVTLTEVIEVQGTIFASIPPSVVVNTPFSYSVSILPAAPAGGLTITVTSFDFPTFTIDFEEGESIKVLQMTLFETGSEYFDFDAPGYVTLTSYIVILDAPDCPEGSINTSDGSKCVRCPGANSDDICSGFGTCVPSTFDNDHVRCNCAFGIGPNCELSFTAPTFDEDGGVISFESNFFDGVPFGTTRIDFTIPSNLLPDSQIPDPNSHGPEGYAYVIPIFQPPAYDGVVDAKTTVPHVNGFTLSAFEQGFLTFVTALDNTVLGYPAGTVDPAALKIFFDPRDLSQTELSTGRLFYWNIKTSRWVPATETCPTSKRSEARDLTELTYSANICAFGQYQFFLYTPNRPNNPVPPEPIERPDDDQLNAPEAPLTTGFAPPLPAAKPDLNGDDGIGLVPLPLYNAASSLLPVSLFVFVSVFAHLLF